jgi:type IV pilus assembly protein PilA
MKKMLKNNKGFTLIELMIVVAIIGILAAIAIPNFMTYQCKAKQTEAKSILGALRVAQEAYYAEYSTYAADTDELDFDTKGGGDYTFSMSTVGTANGFTAQATGNINGTTDTWTVNSTGTFTNNPNACAN